MTVPFCDFSGGRYKLRFSRTGFPNRQTNAGSGKSSKQDHPQNEGKLKELYLLLFLFNTHVFVIYLTALDLSCSMQVLLLQCVDSLAVMHGLQSTQASVTVNAGAVALRHKES